MSHYCPLPPEYLVAVSAFPALHVGLGALLGIAVLPKLTTHSGRAFRRFLHQARRRRTAKALHALRYDREYMWGLLPPIVSAKILSYLDRASLASLRLSSRQAALLVAATGGARLRLDLRDVVHYTSVPLHAVWPRLKVLSLSLHATQDDTTPFLRPKDTQAHSTAAASSEDGSARGHETVGTVGSHKSTGAGMGLSGSGSEPPSANCSVADAALRGLLHAKGLQGLPCLQLLDLSHCSASFELETWQLLANALPEGTNLMVPVSSLQGARRTGYASRAAHVHQVMPALKALSSRSGPDEQQGAQDASQLRPRTFRGLRLELVGVSLQVSSAPALKELCEVGAHLLVRLALSDSYPYTGCLPWAHLSLLSSLRDLSVVPSTPQSLSALLQALPSLPRLTHLSLGDVGSPHSASQSLQAQTPGPLPGASSNTFSTAVQARELAQLQKCPQLTHLEVQMLRLPATLHDGTGPQPRTQHSSPQPEETTATAATAGPLEPHTGLLTALSGPTLSQQLQPTSQPASQPQETPAAPQAASSSATATAEAAATAGGTSAAQPACDTIAPLSQLKSLSALHMEVERPRRTSPGADAPPSAQTFLHLFPGLTQLCLGVCPRSARCMTLGMAPAAAAASMSAASALAAASSSDALDPSGAAAAAAAAAGLPVPRPPPLLAMLDGLQYLESLALSGVWMAQGLRESDPPPTPQNAQPQRHMGSWVTLNAALSGLRHLDIYHAPSCKLLCRFLQHVLSPLNSLETLGLHFCGGVSKASSRAQPAAGNQAPAQGPLHAAHTALHHLQALLGITLPPGLANLGLGGTGVGSLMDGPASLGGFGPLGGAGSIGHGAALGPQLANGAAAVLNEGQGRDLESAGTPAMAAKLAGAFSSLRRLTIEGGDFRIAQEVCLSASHHYADLALIGCDLLLECDVLEALAVRAQQQRMAALAHSWLGNKQASPLHMNAHQQQPHAQQQHEQQQQQQQQQEFHREQPEGGVMSRKERHIGGSGMAVPQAGVALPGNASLEGTALAQVCPLRRLQVLGCRGIDGRSLEVAAQAWKLPWVHPIEVSCTDWRSVDESFGSG